MNTLNSLIMYKGALLLAFFAVLAFGQEQVDPLPACPEGMVYAQYKISPTAIREYCIDQYEFPNAEGEMPQVKVTWYKAKKLCKSQRKRLCSDMEWRNACRGCGSQNLYPYGTEYAGGVCNAKSDEIQPSGKSIRCMSNFGAYDMVGNVAEWTSGFGVGTYGGTFRQGDKARCDRWQPRSLKLKYKDVGFRCCKTLRQRKPVNMNEKDCPQNDFDFDGIPDISDSCPRQPEDMDAFEDLDGCPEVDNDKDGLPDTVDQCPYQAEDVDAFEDEDGCPDLDNDGDGFLDSLDQCPNSREDRDGYRDNDGCADPDNDKDGILDTADRCPDMAGVKENRGCPKKKVATLKIEVKKSIVLKGINFETNSAEFTEESYSALDLTFQTLEENKEIHIEIRGHTDDRGADDFNQRLSQRRADAVRQYLVRRGISTSRLTSMGFGESQPVAPNRSASGRALNRRVELYRSK